MDVSKVDANAEVDSREDFGEWLPGMSAGYFGSEGFDAELVRLAREEEINFMPNIGAWVESSFEDSVGYTGMALVTTRRVDVDKVQERNPDIRNRLRIRERLQSLGEGI